MHLKPLPPKVTGTRTRRCQLDTPTCPRNTCRLQAPEGAEPGHPALQALRSQVRKPTSRCLFPHLEGGIIRAAAPQSHLQQLQQLAGGTRGRGRQ